MLVLLWTEAQQADESEKSYEVVILGQLICPNPLGRLWAAPTPAV